MSKKVLVLCSGNSCRSIIAEALINAFLDGVEAFSAGVDPSGKVNKNAKKVLQNHNIWDDRYCSKTLNDVLDIEFGLVVTVCDNAKESCPVFPKDTKVIHIGFEDPDGKELVEFEKTYTLIKDILLPEVASYLKIDYDPNIKSWRYNCRVYYEDVDVGGVCYHSKYLNFCERARSEIFFANNQLPIYNGYHFIIKKLEADYKKPALFGDSLGIRTVLKRSTRVSVELLQEVFNEKGELLFSMPIQLVCIKDSKMVKMPEKFRSIFEI